MSRRCWRVGLGGLGLWVSTSVSAAVIAEQDFNALDDSGSQTFDSLVDGSLLTNAGSSNSADGLDFTSTFYDTRGANGPVSPTSDSSDFIGVNSFAGSNSPDVAADGAAVSSGTEHNFEFNDTDGRVELVFEPVDVSGTTGRVLTLDYWVADTGYESDDSD